jgi:hypothetical protein
MNKKKKTIDIDITERDKFVLKKRTEGYKVHEILILLDNEGFKVPHRATIYEVLKKHGFQVSE